jgi:hypothetical protein
VVPTLLAAPPLTAQDVQYETVTRIELAGVLGTAMRVAARLGGGSTTTVEKTSIKGRKMRTDVDNTSMIYDLDGRRFTQLDHRARTYTTMTFDEMAAMARQTAQEARAGQGQQQGRQPAAGETRTETHLTFRFGVDDARQREQVAGFDSQRFFLTMEGEGEFTPEGSTQREKGGTLVLLTDMWSSKDMPAFAALNRFQEASAREYANASNAMMEALAAAFSEDPSLKVGFQQSREQIAKMEGMPLKSTTYFVMVGPEHRFNRELALGEGQGAAQQGGRGLRGMAARAAAAARQAEQPAEEQSQATIAKVTSEVRNIRTATLDASLFEVPAGYRQVSPTAGQ